MVGVYGRGGTARLEWKAGAATAAEPLEGPMYTAIQRKSYWRYTG